jgi:hypothetical protein
MLTIAMIILIIVLGFLIGMYAYRIKNLDEEIRARQEVEEEVQILDIENLDLADADLTSAREEKVSQQGIITIRKLYKDCNHVIEKSEKVSESLVNLNKEEFQEKYKDWEIQKFTANEIVLHKVENDFCGEHYAVKELDGYVVVYELDKNDNEAKLLRTTKISTEYLTETDLIKMREGIKVYTNKDLNKLLEDFE